MEYIILALETMILRQAATILAHTPATIIKSEENGKMCYSVLSFEKDALKTRMNAYLATDALKWV